MDFIAYIFSSGEKKMEISYLCIFSVSRKEHSLLAVLGHLGFRTIIVRKTIRKYIIGNPKVHKINEF